MKFIVSLAVLLGMICSVYAENLSIRSPEDVIRSLYNSHEPWNNKEIDLKNKNSLADYFDKDLVDLILRDSDCVRKTKEICRLDFDPILDAQDFEKSDLNIKIKKIKLNSHIASYEVTFTNIDTRILIYELRKKKNKWRIFDILYSNGSSLKNILSAK